MPNITTFDTNSQYIYLPIQVTSIYGSQYEFDAIFDTGAPRTEFSDRALKYAGFVESIQELPIATSLQIQKYNCIILPEVKICGHIINNLDVFVSSFEKLTFPVITPDFTGAGACIFLQFVSILSTILYQSCLLLWNLLYKFPKILPHHDNLPHCNSISQRSLYSHITPPLKMIKWIDKPQPDFCRDYTVNRSAFTVHR